MSRYLIGKAGYNPLATEEEIERLLRRFENNAATRSLVKQLMQ